MEKPGGHQGRREEQESGNMEGEGRGGGHGGGGGRETKTSRIKQGRVKEYGVRKGERGRG